MKDEKNVSRDMLIDIVKGIGILSIVMGHSSWEISVGEKNIPIGPFVYLYHLAIFFFCSGYLFSIREGDFFTFVCKKIKGLYCPFVIYSLFFLVTNNIWVEIGVLNVERIDVGSFIIRLTDILTFNGSSGFLSAFWFLPVLFWTMIIFGGIYIGTLKSGRFQVFLLLFASLAIGG